MGAHLAGAFSGRIHLVTRQRDLCRRVAYYSQGISVLETRPPARRVVHQQLAELTADRQRWTTFRSNVALCSIDGDRRSMTLRKSAARRERAGPSWRFLIQNGAAATDGESIEERS